MTIQRKHQFQQNTKAVATEVNEEIDHIHAVVNGNIGREHFKAGIFSDDILGIEKLSDLKHERVPRGRVHYVKGEKSMFVFNGRKWLPIGLEKEGGN